ncbi:hypothetical protein FE810_03560 [Thalassotalea litorea]|uniref:Outer membrane protein beta-barrel domain-containing protein n=1 Tax=Thalassotalea litorea TaxID=2020715 RepID=A0A5R9IPC1_9GAMM|nr:hypothetical protein [Thalassotalea litorea]TLU67370.1 hypothetical protein FE810_03560 [Thalassotalea litorea]
MKSLILLLSILVVVNPCLAQEQASEEQTVTNDVVEATPAQPLPSDESSQPIDDPDAQSDDSQTQNQSKGSESDPAEAESAKEDSFFAFDDFGYGLGFGILYSGLGGNINVTKEYDMKYASIGCLGHSSEGGLACGLGVGWIRTNLFDVDPFYADKHGIGIYIGAVGSEKSREPSNRFPEYDNETVWGLAGSYHYFLNGIEEPGTNLGASFVIGDGRDDTEFGLLLQVGYQF